MVLVAAWQALPRGGRVLWEPLQSAFQAPLGLENRPGTQGLDDELLLLPVLPVLWSPPLLASRTMPAMIAPPPTI